MSCFNWKPAQTSLSTNLLMKKKPKIQTNEKTKPTELPPPHILAGTLVPPQTIVASTLGLLQSAAPQLV